VTSQAEKFGAALAKAIKGTAASMKERQKPTVIYKTSLYREPKHAGEERESWIDAQVQYLIDNKTADADHTIGRAVLKPGARYENHRLRNCDAFFIVLQGHGIIYTEDGDTPGNEGDVVYAPRGCWHGFNNTSDKDVVLIWGWLGAGTFDSSGHEPYPARENGSAS
jgi:mannose-6-phosphate isomerase-like protein (cupin superfamily)